MKKIKPGHVYLIQMGDTDLYKIGKSQSSPLRRLKELQVGNPETLRLIETARTWDFEIMEKDLHQLFLSKRRKGEWFQLTDQDVVFIMEHMEAYDQALRKEIIV